MNTYLWTYIRVDIYILHSWALLLRLDEHLVSELDASTLACGYLIQQN